jgi:hypothetical protein
MSDLAPTYTCNICRKAFSSGPPIIGETEPQRLSKISQQLANHLGKEHQGHMANIAIAGQQLAGWLICEQFTHNDAHLKRESEKYRLRLHSTTRRVTMPDESIENGMMETLGIEGDLRERVIKLLKAQRNVLEERGALEALQGQSV